MLAGAESRAALGRGERLLFREEGEIGRVEEWEMLKYQASWVTS
jgi:hypothetical protein